MELFAGIIIPVTTPDNWMTDDIVPYIGIKNGITKLLDSTRLPIANMTSYTSLDLETEISKIYNRSVEFVMFQENDLYVSRNNNKAGDFIGCKRFKGDLYCFLKIDGQYVNFTQSLFDKYNRDLTEYRKKLKSLNPVKEVLEDKIIVHEKMDIVDAMTYMVRWALQDRPLIRDHLKNLTPKEYVKMISNDDALTYSEFHSITKASEMSEEMVFFDTNLATLSFSNSILDFLNKKSLKVINIKTYKGTVRKIVNDYLKEIFDEDTCITDPLDCVDEYLYELVDRKSTLSNYNFFTMIKFMKTLHKNKMLTVTVRLREANIIYNKRLLVEVLGLPTF
jgi:hypothetical protein